VSPMTGFRILALAAVVAALAYVAGRDTAQSAAVSHGVSSSVLAGLGSLFGVGESDDEADEDDAGDGPTPRPATPQSPALPVATALISAAIGALVGGFVALRVRRLWVRVRERLPIR
jgi:ABC-type branched-subunit amino acid transport system permease subunit